MKKILTSLLIFMTILAISPVFAQTNPDSLSEKLNEMKDRLNGLDERILTNESDLSKLNKIKLSGYMQAQWENYSNKLTYPNNTFFLRRSRLKATYQPSTGVAFVLQGDFLPSGFTLKDAYVQLNGQTNWNKNFSLSVGQINRLNYEVEYSSSQREVPERSRMIRAIYPGERSLGAKLEYSAARMPLKLQIALFNGNDNQTYAGSTNNVNKDFDNFKDVMVRGTYSFKFGNFGGLDIGAHAYLGAVKAVVDSTLNSTYMYEKNYAIGNPLPKRWAGAEFQWYIDVLGGMAIKGEFIAGSNASPGYKTKTTTVTQGNPVLSGDTLTLTTTTTDATTFQPNFINKFMGYYVYLIKNIGKKNQFALRYDFYDPNTDLSGDKVGSVQYNKSSNTTTTSTSLSHEGNQTLIFKNKKVTSITDKLSSGKSDLAYSTLTLAWQYYYNDNIRITLGYEIPMNEKTLNVSDKTTVNGVDEVNKYDKVFSQNTFTLRLQAKF